VTRLAKEHQEARDTTVETLADNERLKREAELACKTRDSAQRLATQAVNDKRAAEEDTRAVRRALDILLPLLPEPERVAIRLVSNSPAVARSFLQQNVGYRFYHEQGKECGGKDGAGVNAGNPVGACETSHETVAETGGKAASCVPKHSDG
jgi:hypothetical protein